MRYYKKNRLLDFLEGDGHVLTLCYNIHIKIDYTSLFLVISYIYASMHIRWFKKQSEMLYWIHNKSINLGNKKLHKFVQYAIIMSELTDKDSHP